MKTQKYYIDWNISAVDRESSSIDRKGKIKMCTAVSCTTKDHYFGRNLDYEYSYEETVTVMPRNYQLYFRNGLKIENESVGHYAMIGMAYVVDDYPLYYDAINEKGLGMAGLLFAGNAVYSHEKIDGMDNVASFEFIPWILGQCCTVKEAEELLRRINLTEEAFSDTLPPSPLHWMIADRDRTIVVEALEDGIKVYDNPVHVLTNNPSFDFHLMNLNHYMAMSAGEPVNSFAKDVGLSAFSRGMGALGLPGDLSSTSRFVKAAFTRMNSLCGDSEEESISQFFHILGSVYQQRGCVRLQDRDGSEAYERTIYSSCCNATKGIYYYITYDNSCISAVDMHDEDLDGKELVSYSLIKEQQIVWQN